MPDALDVDVVAHAGGFALSAALRVAAGPVALVGPNGAGKTTLLRVLAGALPVASGRVRVLGRAFAGDGAWLPPEARGIGYLPQGVGLFPHLTAQGNVAYGLADLPRPEREARAAAWLARLGAAPLAGRRPRGLSGGEAQRVGLARALAPEPAVLLLDEPTAALDVTARPAIRAVLREALRAPGRCAVVVTHDLRDLVAWDPVVALVDGGRIVRAGPLAALRAAPGHPFLDELLAAA
ncbi:MAG: ATP-binding cassette domain-containing protein [Myxococcota bacterium]